MRKEVEKEDEIQMDSMAAGRRKKLLKEKGEQMERHGVWEKVRI